jgi:transcriptional regulator of acetoin/glycerol metabolism
MPVGADGETRDDCSGEGDEPSVRCEPQLVVVLECDRPASGSARFSLAGVDQVVVGRGEERTAVRRTDNGFTTLHVRVPAASMSGAHARLLRARGTWILEDAGSRNGSFVNGTRVARAVLAEKDVLEMGRVLLMLREGMPLHSGGSDVDSRGLVDEPPGFRTLIPSLAHALAGLKRLAPTGVPVLLLGETGTGKELLARGLHSLSGRRGPFVPVNCGALTPSLLEAQLFGHVKGSFSGADRDEIGFIRSAEGGTLFLDEVGELPRQSQAALLRVLQDGVVTPVGSTRATRADVRVVSATNRDLQADEQFRPDLFARLSGFSFQVPPLRERMLDLGVILADLLAGHPSGSQVTLAPELGMRMLRHGWPYNVRELHQALNAAMALANDGVLRAKQFPILGPTAAAAPGRAAIEEPPCRALSDEDRRLRMVLIERLRENQGNVAAVARSMSKASVQIHRWMKRFGIDPDNFRHDP